MQFSRNKITLDCCIRKRVNFFQTSEVKYISLFIFLLVLPVGCPSFIRLDHNPGYPGDSVLFPLEL